MAPPSRPKLKGWTECNAGYQWYTCNHADGIYAGCCSIDPCSLPDFCPAESQQPEPTRVIGTPIVITPTPASTLDFPSTAIIITSPATSPNGQVAPTAGPHSTSSTAVATPTAASQADSGTGGGNWPVGATIGVSIGAFIVAGFAAVWICMCLGKILHKREEAAASHSARRSHGRRRDGSGSGAIILEKGPGLSRDRPRGRNTPSPVEYYHRHPRVGAAHVFDEFGGRYHEPGSPTAPTDANNIAIHNTHPALRRAADDTDTFVVSPVTPVGATLGNNEDPRTSNSPPELDSTPLPLAELASPVDGDDEKRSPRKQENAAAWATGGGAFGTPRLAQAPIERPRATLKATAYERRSETYANSWTRFHGVQI